MDSALSQNRLLLFIICVTLFLVNQTCFALPDPLTINIEVVCDSTAVGDGGNVWGGHQCRIVRTCYGVFTAFTTEGKGYFEREWHVSQRTADGWHEIAHDVAGREPVNLLAAPDGTLHVIGWPGGKSTMWTISPDSAGWNIQEQLVSGQSKGYWPYNSAGIDLTGNICILSSEGGEQPGGAFRWSYFQAAQQKWTYRNSGLDFRYCYTYVFPNPPAGLSLVSTRDVRWAALGYQKPANASDYVFNAFRYWHADSTLAPLATKSFVEESPTTKFPNVVCNAQKDAYIDTKGNVHVLYMKIGASTNGLVQHRHVVFAAAGDTLFDEICPANAGWYQCIFQDAKANFFLLGDTGMLFLLDQNGFAPVDSVLLDFQGYHVEYSGFGVSVPRTGTPLSDVVDVVFPTNGEKYWVYFSLQLDELFPNASVEASGETLPAQFHLFQNYPNPFNSTTLIRYSLEKPAETCIQIFNLSGQRVAKLAAGRQSRGTYSVQWNGKNGAGQSVATGLYFVRFEADQFVTMKKALFIR
ncbi:T9SS type A sorting domain-containing protein [candidate division KSB1 bacterium]|nr:T9SS type A sorting domain-containing protein [candidate division KSB1 bacterium]